MDLKRTFRNLLIFIIFMTVVVAVVSAVLFNYVPRDEAFKAFRHAARDVTALADSDIVVVYPPLSAAKDPLKFKADADDEVYRMTYVWNYDGSDQSYRAEIPADLPAYYRAKTHERPDYQQYALSDYDRDIIRQFAAAFQENGRRHRYTDDEIAMNIITFAYTLPYTDDMETTGFEDYPRYPVETLVEGGDCEDRAILISALLYELGMENIIIQLEKHAAVGLKDSGNYTGQYYEYGGARYYYAEVSGGNQTIGVIPPTVNQTLVALHPVVKVPSFLTDIRQYAAGTNAEGHLYTIQGTLKNDGPGGGKNISVRIVTTLSSADLKTPAPADKIISIGDIPEDCSADIESVIVISHGSGMVDILVEGDNFETFKAGGFHFNF